jgi:hypothetical protein
MSEIKLTPRDIEIASSQPPSELSWPRVLVGIGFALIFVDVGVSAAAKGALGNLPMYVAYVAGLLIATSGIWGIAQHVFSKRNKRA